MAKKRPTKKIGPGRAAAKAWREFVKEKEPQVRELLFVAFLRGVKVGQANPRVRAKS